MAAAKAGDAGAFRRLYEGHVGRVYAVCLRLVGDPDRAEELTQDVFVRVWERLDRYRGESAFSTWLYRVAVNLTLMALRQEKRRSLRLDFSAPVEGIPQALPRPDDAIDLEQAIAMLPPGCRTVFVLYDVEGWSHADIAQEVGIQIGTSKAHLFRARRLLRERLIR